MFMFLDRYDTVRLLITKGWEHKDVPKKKEETIEQYSKRVFAKQVAVDSEYFTDNDLRSIWVSFANDYFDLGEFRQFVSLVTQNGYESLRAIIAIVQGMKISSRFELDESDISGGKKK